MPDRHLIPSWDLLVVLRALTGLPFEPLEKVDMKFVSLKTTLLLALMSAKRALVGALRCQPIVPSVLDHWGQSGYATECCLHTSGGDNPIPQPGD